MKMFSLALLTFMLSTSLVKAQESFEEPPAPSAEEEFYSGDQVNTQGEYLDYERQEEEAMPYDPYEEIYPYENLEMEGEEEYEQDY